MHTSWMIATITMLAASMPAQTMVQLSPIADAMVRSDQSTANFGSSVELGLAKDKDATTNAIYFMRSYLQFDLAKLKGLPPVSKATLYVYELRTIAAGGLPVGAYEVTGSWSESKVTWATAPANGAKSYADVKVGDNFNRGWKAFDVTSLVEAHKQGTSTNNGIVLRLASESTAGAYRPAWLASRENTTTTLRPYLVVEMATSESFAQGCGPVATWPRLAVSAGAPKIGTKFIVTGSLLAPSSPCLVVAGASNQSWGSVKLPLLLDSTVSPACQLLVSMEWTFYSGTDSNGNCSVAATVPSNPLLYGYRVYVQMATIGKANYLTEGLRLTMH